MLPGDAGFPRILLKTTARYSSFLKTSCAAQSFQFFGLIKMQARCHWFGRRGSAAQFRIAAQRHEPATGTEDSANFLKRQLWLAKKTEHTCHHCAGKCPIGKGQAMSVSQTHFQFALAYCLTIRVLCEFDHLGRMIDGGCAATALKSILKESAAAAAHFQ